MDIIAKLNSKLACQEDTNSLEPASSLDQIVLRLLEEVQNDRTECFQAFFDCVEHELIFGDRQLQDSLIIHLLEALKNHASLRDIDYAIFENWLGPETHVAWRWLEKRWQGKTSLRDTASR